MWLARVPIRPVGIGTVCRTQRVPGQNVGCTKSKRHKHYLYYISLRSAWGRESRFDGPFRRAMILGPIKNRYLTNRFHIFIGPRFYAIDVRVHRREQNACSYLNFFSRKGKERSINYPLMKTKYLSCRSKSFVQTIQLRSKMFMKI